jgi:hypothetical protein
MQLRMWCWCVLAIGVPRAASAAPEPPPASCAAPTPARLAAIRASLGKAITPQDIARGTVDIAPICEERDGWLVTATYDLRSPPPAYDPAEKLADGRYRTVWLVPTTNQPAHALAHWTIGPVLDFDGDGTPEASTVSSGELKIWFADGRG